VESTAKEFGRDSRTGKAMHEKVHQAGAAASEEVQNLISDVEDLIDRVGEAADPEVKRLRAKVADAVVSTKRSIATGAGQVQRQAKEVFDASDRYVRNQPWEAIGIAALAGIAVGFLVSSSRRSD
jgi:ElaB protein